MIFDKSKPDGTHRKLMDNKKLKLLNWRPKISIEEGIVKTLKEFELLA